MELGISKMNTGYLVEELAAKQPLSIAYLRQYLAPSTLLSSLPATQPRKHAQARGTPHTLADTAAKARKTYHDGIC